VGYRKYAAGGLFSGGLRLVGERGPELEATGPSRIWSADQTRGILAGNDNAALIAEIRALREEVASLRNEQRADMRDVKKNTKDSADVLKAAQAGAVPISTQAA
jgi:hypothetical protein